MKTIDPAVFTSTMSRIPGPVSVATTVTPSGLRFGFTGSSLSSLSLDPPMVLICLSKSASTHTAFTHATQFMINVLAAGQSEVALRFAQSGVDRFAAGDMRPCELGLPGLPDAAARLACALVDVLDGGDHSILTGRVLEASVGARSPLVYWDRSFNRPVPLTRTTTNSSRK
ncbi:flavin reductase family protein [Nocardia terpenica]|uniref:Flavin reductase n=1 Tax=Nocardia terpenica TaxID=455432 RepID=A0A6G9Z8S3_9NOCA|nr:flavin reductase family protein [Nocardia terpenica]QIS21820.1 flavin reductase [Nocardia terpenica]